MEETNALLSRLVQTKSVEKVLAPIAAKLSQLIILNEEYETGKRTTFPCDLRWSASILKATESFVDVARRLGQNASDDELREQMPAACDMLSVAAQTLVTAQQGLKVENFRPEARKHLIRTAKDILEGTIKVFLVSDDAEVRTILRSINWVTDRLGVLTAVRSMKNLVPAFKAFIESLMLLINLLKKRQAELVHPRQRECLLTYMATLRRLVPMLSSALQTYVKYNDNQQAKASRDYAVGSVLDCLKEVEELVRNPYTQDSDYFEEEDEHPGHFITMVDKIVDAVSADRRGPPVVEVGGDLDLLVETAVRHSMAVAHLATAHHRSLVVTNAQRVLHQRSLVSQLGGNYQENPTYEEVGDDFNEACDLLEQEVTDLERHVNSALLQLVVVTFSETTQPMERLVKAALKPLMNREHMAESESEGLLEPYISGFHSHSDKMCQVGRFLGASSAESRRVRVIRSCISLLEKLDPELVPATIACRSDLNNKAAVEHLRLLKKEWCNTVSTLVNTVDDIIDSKDFLEISVHEVREAVNSCKRSIYSDIADVAEVTRLLIGLTSRAVHVGKVAVDKNDDPIFRNGVMIHINQLNKVIPAIKTSANRVLNDMGEMRLHETLHRRADTALTEVSELLAGLRGEGHPHLMSPSRVQARGPDHLKALSDALAECELDDDHLSVSRSPKMRLFEEELTATGSMKTYIAELTDSRLVNLRRELVTAAVAGNLKAVDVLSNDVLIRTNHVVEVARGVQQHDQQHTEALAACCLQLSQMTPELIDLSQKACSGDIDQVEPLHQAAEKWAGTVTYLEGLVDGILNKWVQVSYKVVDAAKVGNIALLKIQIQGLEDHRRHVAGLRELLADGAEIESIVTQERLRVLHEYMDEFESQTTMLATVADMLAQTDNDDEKAQLERTAREWAGLAFALSASVDKLAEESLEQVKGDLSLPDWDDARQVQDTMRRFTEDTIRLKDVVRKVTKGMQDQAERKARLEEMLDNIDMVVSEMAASCEILTKRHSPVHTIDRMYAPLRVTLYQWQWAVKVQEMWLTIDDVTLEYSLQVEQLLSPPAATAEAAGASPDATVSVTDLKQRVSQTVDKVKQALTPLRDPAQRSLLHRDLQDLTSLTDTLVSSVESHRNTPSEKSQSEVKWLGRSWACKAHTLMYSLSDISAVESSVVQEANSLLKGPGRFSCSTPGDATNKTPTSRPVADRVLRNLSNTPSRPKSTNQEEKKSNLATSNSQDNASPKLTAVGSGRKVTFDRSTYGERETQSVSTYIADYENITIRATTSKVPGVPEMSYRELSATPRIQHRQPDPPSTKSGFRVANTKSISFDKAMGMDADKWEDENNAIVRVAKEMTQHLRYMADFSRDNSEGLPRSKVDLISAAKAVAKNGESLVKFAKVLAEYCIDKRLSKDLLYYADHVPMVATQLNMLASVKAASPDDTTTEKMLAQTAEKLLSAISKMLHAAEAACVKGLRQPPSDALDETEAIVLATQWHHGFTRHRRIEKSNMSMDELGLRRVSQPRPAPTLTQIVGQK